MHSRVELDGGETVVEGKEAKNEKVRTNVYMFLVVCACAVALKSTEKCGFAMKMYEFAEFAYLFVL